MTEILEQTNSIFLSAAGLVALVIGVRLAGFVLLWLVRSAWIRTPPSIEGD